MAVTPANKIVRGGDLQTVGTEIKSALAGKVGSSTVSTIVSLTQAQYNALATKDANTAYIITDAQSGGGTTEVFWATYGTTTFGDIWDAINTDKKIVLCQYQGWIYYCIGENSQGQSLDFVCLSGYGYNPEIKYVSCDSNSGWYNGTSALQDISEKVTSLSSSSTDTQYPSAKAVYDMIGDVETLLAAL